MGLGADRHGWCLGCRAKQGAWGDRERRGLPYSRQRLQNGTVDLSVEVPIDEALPLLRELKRAGIFYGSIDAFDIAEDDPRIDALLSFDPHLIVGVEV